MQPNIVALPERCSLASIDVLLSTYPDAVFPVVSKELFLIGLVRRSKLEVLLKHEVAIRHPDYFHVADRTNRLAAMRASFIISSSFSVSAASAASQPAGEQMTSGAAADPSSPSELHVISLDDDPLAYGRAPSTPTNAPIKKSTASHTTPRTRNLQRFDYSAYTDELRQIEVRIPHQSVPVRLLADTSLVHVHMLFISLQLQSAFVTKYGQLIGQVTRRALCETLSVSPHTPSANEVALLAQVQVE